MLLVFLVTLLEALDAAALGLTTKTPREERMALRANVDAKLLLRRARRELVAAAASHRRLEKLGMDSFFHALHLTFLPFQEQDTSGLCARLVKRMRPHILPCPRIGGTVPKKRRRSVNSASIIAQRKITCKEIFTRKFLRRKARALLENFILAFIIEKKWE